MQTGNIIDKFKKFDDYWKPHIIAELNGQMVKIAKVKGIFPWHKHEEQDEMFYVVKGKLKIDTKDHEYILKEGDYLVIPKGVEHQPSAAIETHIILFEPAETLNTGNVINEFTKQKIEKI